MNESDFNKAVCKKLPTTVKVWKIRDDYQGGVPDNFFMADGNVLWCEFKYIKSLPKRDTTIIKPNLSELQWQWLMDLQMNNQNSKVLMCVGSGRTAQAVMMSPQQARVGITAAEFTIKCKTGYLAISELITRELN